MTTLEFHIATLALIATMGLLTWINWKWKKQFQVEINLKIQEWEKCFQERLATNHSIVKRFTEERLAEFREELKPDSRPRKASQSRKAVSLLKIKKTR